MAAIHFSDSDPQTSQPLLTTSLPAQHEQFLLSWWNKGATSHMMDAYETHGLQDAELALCRRAARRLINKREIRNNSQEGTGIYAYDWLPEHNELWASVRENITPRLKSWISGPEVAADKSILTIDAGKGITSKGGDIGILIPVCEDEVATEIFIGSPDHMREAPWRHNVLYMLRGGTNLRTREDEITMVLIKVRQAEA